MALLSRLFAGDSKLDACLTNDAAHLVVGTTGEHVSKVQTALFLVEGISVSVAELRAKLYGKSTAAAVLAYKKRRNIVNRTYQTQEDDIVGKMTIASLDADVQRAEARLADSSLRPHRKSFV